MTASTCGTNPVGIFSANYPAGRIKRMALWWEKPKVEECTLHLRPVEWPEGCQICHETAESVRQQEARRTRVKELAEAVKAALAEARLFKIKS